MDQIDKMSIQWDVETGTPYAFFKDGKGGLVSYDDEQSICLKTEYAIRENLNGFVSCIISFPEYIYIIMEVPSSIVSFSASDYLGALRRCHGGSHHTIA